MALQVWLPLLGNLNNQGLSTDFTMTSGNTAGFSEPGKLGNTSYTSSTALTLNIPSMSGLRKWTVCFWGYVVSESITINWTRILKMYDESDGLRVEVCPIANYSGNYCYSIHNNASYKITHCTGITTSGFYDQWVHFTLMSDGNNIYKYINGNSYGSSPYDGSGTITGIFEFVNSDKIYKQDIRIYDDCLSDIEVKELAQGLILHYKMDNQAFGNVNNLIKTQYFSTYPGSPISNRAGVVNKISSFENAPITCGNQIVTDVGFQVVAIAFIEEIIEVNSNTEYTYSMFIKPGSNFSYTNNPILLIVSECNDDIASEDSVIGQNGFIFIENNSQLYQNGWRRIWGTFTTSIDTKTVSIMVMTQSYDNIDIDWLIGGPQLELGNQVRPYIYGSYINNLVDDCSGNGYTGIATNITVASDTNKRYQASYFFNNDASCKIFNTQVPKIKKDLTFACWCKVQAGSSSSSFLVSYGRDNPQNGFNLILHNSSDVFKLVGYNFNISSSVVANNEWHHLVGTYDGATVKLYVDGILKASAAFTSDLDYTYADAFAVGKMGYLYTNSDSYFPTNGYIQDVRVYATALSEKDVFNLYSDTFSVDNKEQIHAYELSEETLSNEYEEINGTVYGKELIQDSEGNIYKVINDNIQSVDFQEK